MAKQTVLVEYHIIFRMREKKNFCREKNELYKLKWHKIGQKILQNCWPLKMAIRFWLPYRPVILVSMEMMSKLRWTFLSANEKAWRKQFFQHQINHNIGLVVLDEENWLDVDISINACVCVCVCVQWLLLTSRWAIGLRDMYYFIFGIKMDEGYRVDLSEKWQKLSDRVNYMTKQGLL